MADRYHITHLNPLSDLTHRHPGPTGHDSRDALPAIVTSDCSRFSDVERDNHDRSVHLTDTALLRASTSTLCVGPSFRTSDTSQPSIGPHAGKQRGQDTGLPVNRCFFGVDPTATERPSGRGDHAGGPSHHHATKRRLASVVGGTSWAFGCWRRWTSGRTITLPPMGNRFLTGDGSDEPRPSGYRPPLQR